MSRGLPRLAQRQEAGEMQRILAEHVPGVEVVGLDDVPAYDEPVEDQPTFEGNALLKARAGCARDRAADARRRQRPVRRRAQRHAGRAVGALGGRRRKAATSATTRCCSPSSPTCPTSGAAPTSRARSPSCHPDGTRAGRARPDGRPDHPRAAGERRVRLRRAVRRRRARRGRPHHGRAGPGREGPRSPTAAGRCARSRPQVAGFAGLSRVRRTSPAASRAPTRRLTNMPQSAAKTNMKIE